MSEAKDGSLEPLLSSHFFSFAQHGPAQTKYNQAYRAGENIVLTQVNLRYPDRQSSSILVEAGFSVETGWSQESESNIPHSIKAAIEEKLKYCSTEMLNNIATEAKQAKDVAKTLWDTIRTEAKQTDIPEKNLSSKKEDKCFLRLAINGAIIPVAEKLIAEKSQEEIQHQYKSEIAQYAALGGVLLGLGLFTTVLNSWLKTGDPGNYFNTRIPQTELNVWQALLVTTSVIAVGVAAAYVVKQKINPRKQDADVSFSKEAF